MLIDSSYFIGHINVPNKDTTDVQTLLGILIKEHETELLEGFMGYELFKNFSAGLLETTVASKWLDILFGKEYTSKYDNRLKKWRGLVTTNAPTMVISAGEIQPIFFTVGDPGQPAVGDSSYINTSLAGKIYYVSQRSLGKLRVGVDIDLRTGGGFDWRGGNTFAANQTFDISFTGIVIDVVAGGYQVIPDKISPIAYYVYYWWMRNNYSFTPAMNFGTNQVPVAHSSVEGLNMKDAFNKCAEQMRSFRDFLYSSLDIYPEFEKQNYSCGIGNWITNINEFNIL